MKQLTYILLSLIACGMLSCGDGDNNNTTSALDSTTTSVQTYSERLPVYIDPTPLRRLFNDVNDLHLEAAKAIGINPISNLRDAYNLKSPIQHIATCDNYAVEHLTHSLPFLVPRAAQLLDNIGQRFADTIRARGNREYRIKVTSLLRTNSSVDKLRKRNINASETSAHCFGTTFDISYSKFICKDSIPCEVAQEDLKNILGEILDDERKSGNCYVKFEVKQGCFHITARQ